MDSCRRQHSAYRDRLLGAGVGRVCADVAGAVAVFAAFHYMVFSRMFHKHKRRISQKGDSNCLMGFFDARGWIIMAFMITLGVSIRRYELMPLWFIAPFYTGLSSALVLTGIRFLFSSKFWNRKSVG